MTKFRLSDSETVIASVKDPVALDCISKLAQNAADNSTVSVSQQPQQDLAINLISEEPTPLPKVDDLPSSTDGDLSAITPLMAAAVTDSSDYNVKVLSQGVSQQTNIGSEIPLFFAPHDLLSVPVITLPLVACSIASSGDLPTFNQAANSSKSFVTVATVSELNSLPENVIIKPTYRPL